MQLSASMSEIVNLLPSKRNSPSKKKSPNKKSKPPSESADINLDFHKDQYKNCKINSMFNHKGGVGKTTQTLNMAYVLSVSQGKRTLLIDADSQCNLSAFLASRPDPDVSEEDIPVENDQTTFDYIRDVEPANLGVNSWTNYSTILDVVKPIANGNPAVSNPNLFQTSYSNLALLPGDHNLNILESIMSFNFGQNQNPVSCGCFRILFENLADNYNLDYIFVDVGPSCGVLNQLILMSCDLIIPVAFPDSHSYYSLHSLLSHILSIWLAKYTVFNSNIHDKYYSSVWGAFPKIGPLVITNYKFKNKKGETKVLLNGNRICIAHSQIIRTMRNLMAESLNDSKINHLMIFKDSPLESYYCLCNMLGGIMGNASTNRTIIAESQPALVNRLNAFIDLLNSRL